MLRFILVSCALAVAHPCAAQSEVNLTPRFDAPREGVTVDESFIVELPGKAEVPCVAIEVGDTRVVVSRKILDVLARARPFDLEEKSAAERMAMHRGERARILLAVAEAGGDKGCAEMVRERELRDARYLVLELLISANAMVVDAKDGRILERIRVHYRATRRSGGEISFHREQGSMFLRVHWWVG